MKTSKTNAEVGVTAALNVLADIDRATLTDGQTKLLDACEIGLTLLEQEMDGSGRDPELAEHARLAFGIN